MKMKRLLIVVSMLAVMFSLASCSNEVPKPFEYDDSQIVIDTMYQFQNYVNVSDEYADYYLNDGTDFEKSAVKGIKQAQDTDNVGAFEDFSPYVYATSINLSGVDYSIVNSTDSVSVTVLNRAENRDVEITIIYKENPDYYIKLDQYTQGLNDPEAMQYLLETYNMTVEDYKSAVEQQLASDGVYKYLPTEMVVTAVYSKGELLKQAAGNTVIGMGTVFVVLIFISFIISLFKFLPAIFAKKPKLEESGKSDKKDSESVKTSAPVVSAPAASDNLMNDAELVAVITAAIYAASESTGCTVTSKDKLVVRSIRKVRR